MTRLIANENEKTRVRSSEEERHVDIVEVGVSKSPAPTKCANINKLSNKEPNTMPEGSSI